MYELKNNLNNPFKDGFGTDSSEKRQKGVNLYRKQWKLLDQIAEEKGKSRNQVLREILEDWFSNYGGGSK